MAEKVASLYAEIGADTSKLEGGLKESKGGLDSVVGSFTELSSAIGIAEKGFGMVKGAIDATVGATVAYAGEVRSLSQAFSISTEEASRMLQLADDMKVSNGTLTTAFREMAKNGIQPTTANLANLAAEYQAIKDPAEKAQFALKNFGRAGLELTPILRLTSAEMKEMGQSAQDAGLIMSGEAVQAARDYEIAMDDLSDSAEGLKVKIGTALIPALTEMLNEFSQIGDVQRESKALFDAGKISLGEYINLTAQGVGPAGQYSMTLEQLNEAYSALIAPQQAQAAAMQGATSMAVEAAIAAGNLAEATNTLTAKTDEISPVYGEAEAALAKFNIGESTRLDLEEKIAIVTGRLTVEDLARRDAIGFLTKQLELGNITQEEYLASLERLASGADTAEQAIRRVGGAITSLPSSKDIDINVRTHGAAGEIGLGGDAPVIINPGPDIQVGDKRAGGGPVMAGESYMVGERGPERFTPAQNGVITPNDKLAGGLFAGATIILRDDADIETLATRVASKMKGY